MIMGYDKVDYKLVNKFESIISEINKIFKIFLKHQSLN
jgi:hypothetical protein